MTAAEIRQAARQAAERSAVAQGLPPQITNKGLLETVASAIRTANESNPPLATTGSTNLAGDSSHDEQYPH